LVKGFRGSENLFAGTPAPHGGQPIAAGRRRQFRVYAAGETVFGGGTPALGTMTVAAGIVDDVAMAAALARRDKAALGDPDFELAEARVACVGPAPGRAAGGALNSNDMATPKFRWINRFESISASAASLRVQAVHDGRGAPGRVDEHGFRRTEPFVGMERALFPNMG